MVIRNSNIGIHDYKFYFIYCGQLIISVKQIKPNFGIHDHHFINMISNLSIVINLLMKKTHPVKINTIWLSFRYNWIKFDYKWDDGIQYKRGERYYDRFMK